MAVSLGVWPNAIEDTPCHDLPGKTSLPDNFVEIPERQVRWSKVALSEGRMSKTEIDARIGCMVRKRTEIIRELVVLRDKLRDYQG